MGNPTMSERLLEAADALMEAKPRSSAFKRRAVSTAYYAVFHALDKLCSDYLSRSSNRNSGDYVRIYRSLDHGPLKNAFTKAPLKDDPKLKKLGATISKLQSERHKADYSPPAPGLFTKQDVEELLDQARNAVTEIQEIKPSHSNCKTLAISLMFKER